VKQLDATLLNNSRDLERVPVLIEQLVAGANLPRGPVAAMNVALDEVLSNVVKYGYPDEGVHHIQLRLLLSDEELVAEVRDDGRPFNPLNAAVPDLGAPLARRAEGGLGIHFVRTLMTAVTYTREAKHNLLVLRISLEKPRIGPNQ
jgi:anti-sigma regulatory factor (Ser/Thr protein kinase)